MALRIRIEHGQDAGKTLRLPIAGLYRAGRSPQCSFQIVDMKVSKEHFEIALDPANGTTIRDLHSTHGTLLNGQRVEADARPLAPGDEIRVGLTVLRALSDGPCEHEAKPVAPLPPPAAPGPARASASSTPSGPPPGTTSMTSGSLSSVSSAGAAAAVPSGPGAGPGGAGKTVGTPAAKSMPPDALVGTTLAGYKLLEKVGAGGMGSVYRAEQLSLHREVAIKVLAEKLVSDSAFVDQFVNEARAAGQLNHPNVVQVYDVGQADGRHFFSMEFIHGGSLESKIPKGKAPGTHTGVKWQDVLPWFLDASNALIFAEKKGILHRDIKPDNFMLGQDGSVKLCDLGLAKKSESADLLAQGIIGTPHFISPEAIRRRTDVDARADLYSLGCTFYRLLTGKNPYQAPSVKEILLAQLNAPVPLVRSSASDVPKELDEIVGRLMQKDVSVRYQSAKELWEALDKVRLQFGLEAHGLNPKGAKKIAIVAAAFGVAAIGALIYFKPWEEKTKTVIEQGKDRLIGDPEADRKMRAAEAKEKYSTIIANAAINIGDIRAGENWRDAKWAGVVKELREVAENERYKDTDGAQLAKGKAEEIETTIQAKKASLDATEKLRVAAAKEAKGLADAGATQVTALIGEGKLLEADKKLDETVAAVKKAGAGSDAAHPLLHDADLTTLLGPLDEQRKAILTALEAGWKKLASEADAAGASGTSTALDDEAAVYQKWIDSHPDAGAGGEVARKVNEYTRTAISQKTAIGTRKSAARRRDLVDDEALAFAWLVAAYAPKAEDLREAGLLVKGQWEAAAEKAQKAAAAAKTPEYQQYLKNRARDCQLLDKLMKGLADGFDKKGIKDKLEGAGKAWAGTLKDVTTESVITGDGKTHAFHEEGLGWVYDNLCYDSKSVERFEYDADAHEALGLLAFAAAVTASIERADDGTTPIAVSPKRFDAALAEWAKAAAADSARAERLKSWGPIVDHERKCKAALDASAVSTQLLIDFIAENSVSGKGMLDFSDLTKAQKARDDVKGQEEQRTKLLADAKASLDEVERGFAATISRALLGDKPPANSTYAGEVLPPDVARPPTPAPTPPTPPPGTPMTPAAPASMDGNAPPPAPPANGGPPLPAAPAPTSPGMSGGSPNPGPEIPAMDGAAMDGAAMDGAAMDAPAMDGATLEEPTPAMSEPRRGGSK